MYPQILLPFLLWVFSPSHKIKSQWMQQYVWANGVFQSIYERSAECRNWLKQCIPFFPFFPVRVRVFSLIHTVKSPLNAAKWADSVFPSKYVGRKFSSFSLNSLIKKKIRAFLACLILNRKKSNENILKIGVNSHKFL